MAAGIYENDWMFSGNGQHPWHGIGTVVDDCPTSDEAIKLAGLGWEVVQSPVCLENGIVIPGWFANVRQDTGEALGLVKTRYNLVQNKEAFNFVDDIIENTYGVDCHYETAGSLFNGKRIFLLVKLPDVDLVGDRTENYMFFMNSHDGQSPFIAGVSSVRVVCNNTLQFAISQAGKLDRLWTVRHTKNLEERKAEAARSLKLAVNYQQEAAQLAWNMAAKKVNEEEFFKKLFNKWNTEASDKSKEKLYTTIHQIYTGKDDLQNFRGSAWGLYNAVADHLSNGKTRTSADNKMLQFCTGNDLLKTTEAILFEVA